MKMLCMCACVCVCVGMPAHLCRPVVDPITDNSWDHGKLQICLTF